MNTKRFCETLYASCDGVIMPRRKSLLIPVLLLIAGIGLPFLGGLLEDNTTADTLHSALVICGIGIALVGAVLLLGRSTGEGEPYHLERRCFLRSQTRNYENELRSEVLYALDKGDYKALLAIPTSEVSGFTVLIYALPDETFAAAQAYEYTELEYRPLGSVSIMKR